MTYYNPLDILIIVAGLVCKMFRAIYPNASKLKYITSSIVKISDEAPFHVRPEELEIKIVSPDKTMLCLVKLPMTAFEEYSVDTEEYFIVSSTELNKLARRGTRGDVVELTLDKENSALVFALKDKKTGFERVFQLMAELREPEPFPDLSRVESELGVTFTMDASDFKHLVGDLKVFGETAVFTYSEGRLIVTTTEQQKEYVGEFAEGSPLLFLSSTKEKASSSYNIDLLKTVVKPASAAKQVKVSFDQDKPMKIEYELLGGASIIFWLVPRLE